MALWRGPALAGLLDVPFAAAHAARLEERRMAALETCIDAELALGRHRELVGELGSLVDEQPLRERLRGQLMLALYRSGRQADALAVHQAGRRVLAEELGLDPGPELRALEASILDHAPELDLVENGGSSTPPPPPPAGAVAPLPVPLTPFVGRADEQEQLQHRLDEHRLVTVTGPGGAGKTRLALAVAAGRQAQEPVWLAELGPLAAGAGVADAVAAVVGAREAGAHGAVDPVDRMTAVIGARPALLVLDNAEHVADQAAVVAARLLAGCPELRLLVTSREPLGIPGEAQLPLGPLLLDAAVQVFENRASAARPDFALDADSRPVVEDLCRRLDGLPLAVELAAARAKVLPVGEILARLDDRFALLTSGDRTALPHHQTLRAAVAWSHDLLEDDERELFARLGVFSGTFDLSAVTAVAADTGMGDADVLDLVGRLVDRSLVVVRGDRFDLLETLRVFAREQAELSGFAAGACEAHARHVTAVAEQARGHLFEPDQVSWLDRIEVDLDNERAALRWALEHEPTLALRLADGIAGAWWIRGRAREARAALDAALADALEPSLVRVRALRWASQLADAVGADGSAEDELDLAARRVEEAMALSEQLGDPSEVAHSQRHLAVALVRRSGFDQDGDVVERARALADEATATFRALDDGWATGACELIGAFVALTGGDLDGAAARTAAAESHLRASGDRVMLDRLLQAQAMIAELQGEPDRAADLHREALALCTELGFEEGRVGHLVALADLGASDGDRTRTADGFESVDELGAAAAARAAGGRAAFERGDLDLAELLQREALERYRHLRLSSGAAEALDALAHIAEGRGDVGRAADLRAAAADPLSPAGADG
jgi:predicted ATPase